MSLCADRGDRTHTLLRELDFESNEVPLPERLRIDVCQECVILPALWHVRKRVGQSSDPAPTSEIRSCRTWSIAA